MFKFPKLSGLPAFAVLSVVMLIAIIFAVHDQRLPAIVGGDFWTQVSATILGAIVAAVFSYWLARHAVWQAERAQGFQLLVKVSLIANDLAATMRSIDESLSEANLAGDTGLQMWQRVLPVVGNMPIEAPTPTELAPLFAARKDDLGNGIIEIAMRYHSFRSALERYNQLREEIRDLMPVHEVKTSDVRRGTTLLTPEEAAKLQPRFVELENLIRQIVRDGRADIKQVVKAADQLGPALRRIFNDNSFPILTMPPLYK